MYSVLSTYLKKNLQVRLDFQLAIELIYRLVTFRRCLYLSVIET